jgi:hypothetical protein
MKKMINKNGLNWLVRSLAAASLVMGVAACGDDDNNGNETPDANVVEADACVGHTCTGESGTMVLAEGGVTRFELFDFGDNADATKNEYLGGWSFYFTGQQNPPTRGVVGAAVPEGTITYPGGEAYCYDNTAHNYFLSGYSAEGQAIVDSRTYYDVGESLYVEDADGNQIVLAKKPDEKDPTNLLQHDYLYLTDPADAANLQRGMKYTLKPIAPAGNFPGLDLKAGIDVPLFASGDAAGAAQGADQPPVMYFPHDFSFVNPTREEFYAYNDDNAGPGFVVDDSGDYTFQWTRAAGVTNPAEWATQVQFVGFLSPEQTIEYLCVVPDPVEDGATGSMVVPQGLFTQPGFPTTGKMIVGSLTHIAWNLSEHRYDILGVNCKFASKFTLQSAVQ